MLPLTSVSASVTSSVAWVRSFGFFHIFGAVTAVWAAIQVYVYYHIKSYGTPGHTGDVLPSCVLVLTIQENEAATALRRIQLDITTFCFNAVITKSLEQH